MGDAGHEDITHAPNHVHFFSFCTTDEHTLEGFNVGENSLEDQMDLMNTHLLTSWVWGTHRYLVTRWILGKYT